MIFRFFIAAILSFYLFSCASNKSHSAINTAEKSALNPVYVTNKIKVYPLSPSEIEKEIEGVQVFSGQFTFRHKKLDFSSIVYLQADNEGIVLMLLSDFGVEAGTIFFDGKEARIDSKFFPENIKCEYIILDLQNAYYPESALKTLYKNAGLDFTQIEENGKTIRLIKSGKKVIEEIVIDDEAIVISNDLRKYVYRLNLPKD